MILIWLFGSLFLLMLMGIPIAVSIGLASLVTILATGMNIPLELIPRQMFTGMDSFALMAIPFFIFAGELMNEGGLTTRIIDFAEALVGHIKGSLAHVNTVVSLIFAGVSGSGAADAAAEATVLIPAMEEKGYSREFSVAITAATAVVGPIIPPSVLFIIYGYLTGVSIGALFVAGAIPGLILGIALMAITHWQCRRLGFQQDVDPFSWQRLRRVWLSGVAAILAPVVIVGSILTGIATATEAGVVAIIIAIFLGSLFYGELRSFDSYKRVITSTLHTTAMVFFIIGTSGLFANILTRERFQDQVIDVLEFIARTPTQKLLTIVVFMVILGMFIDVTPLLIMFAAPLASIGADIGFDPVFFGVILVISATIGGATPPVGGFLIISAGVARIPITAPTRVLLPMLGAIVVALILMILFPETVTFLPNLVFG